MKWCLVVVNEGWQQKRGRQSGRSRAAALLPADTHQEVMWLTHQCQAGNDTMWNASETLSPTERQLM